MAQGSGLEGGADHETTGDALALLAFVTRARRLGFTLAEVKDIVALRRAGQVPCPHVRDLVRGKVADLDRAAADLSAVRQRLRGLLRSWRAYEGRAAQVCPHIEHSPSPKKRRTP